MSVLTDIDKIFEGLNENERRAVIKILSEQANSGKSQSLYQLCDADWEELPVDIDTFLESPKYLGNSTNNGTAIYPYWRNAYREIIEQDKIEIALGGSIGSGKASTLDSHIVGPDGYFKMRDAYIGREVIGQDGKTYKINGIFPQGIKSVYKITFNDNTYVKCTEDHLWNIKEASSDENTPYITKSVRWMLDQGVRNERNQLNFKIPVTLPVNFNSKDELPLDPYLVGHLISNAYIDETTIDVSIHEQDIVDKISAILDKYECVLYNYTPDDASKFHIINKFKNKNVSNPVVLSAMNLGLDKNPGVKLIPKIYLHASIEDRIQLLQGMFCSSGYIYDNKYFYTTVSEQLFNDFKYLIESLGGYVIIPKPEPNYYTDTDSSISYTDSYIRNICFRLPNYITPLSSSKHYSEYTPSHEYDKPYLHRFITNIEYVGEEECQCISVDNPEGLYLMDNFTVTHNTTAAIYLMIYFVYKLMCLKNIRQYYGLEGNGPICVCFLNNTLQLSKGVAYDKFMSTVANSPWFLERGEVRGTVNVRYKPRKNIEFIIGSSSDQIIGRDIFCLSGDSEILTLHGYKTLASLAGTSEYVYTKTNNGLELSAVPCEIVHTKDVLEMMEIELENGYVIRCTPEHKLLTVSGEYVRASELSENDELADVTKTTDWKNLCFWAQLHHIESITFLEHYIRFITKRLSRSISQYEYVELHHIVPQCLMDTSIRIKLTAEEHFTAHYLLARALGGTLWYAVHIMSSAARNNSRYGDNHNYAISRRCYSEIRRQCANMNKLMDKTAFQRAALKHNESIRGYRVITNGINDKRVSEEELPDWLSNGWRLGSVSRGRKKPWSSEAKQRSSNRVAQREFKRNEERLHKRKLWKQHLSEIYKGSGNPNYGKPGAVTGKIAIHRGNECCYIYESDLYNYEKDGWVRGRSSQAIRNAANSCRKYRYYVNDVQLYSIKSVTEYLNNHGFSGISDSSVQSILSGKTVKKWAAVSEVVRRERISFEN